MDYVYSVEIFRKNVLIRDRNLKVLAFYDHQKKEATKCDINTLEYKIAKQLAIDVHRLVEGR